MSSGSGSSPMRLGLSWHEAEALIEGTDPPWQPLVCALVYSGIRLQGLCELRWTDVDLREGRARIPQAAAHRGRRPQIAITPRFGQLLSEMPDRHARGLVFKDPRGRRVKPEVVKATVLRQSLKAARLPVGFRGFRRALAERLARDGGAPDVLATSFGLRFRDLPSPEASDPWRRLAEEAVAQSDRTAIVDDSPKTAAFMLGTVAELHGWDSVRARRLLKRLRRLQNPGGGYGLRREYEPFGDGIVNPSDTSYTVTIAGHVGRVLLDGHMAGAVPRKEVQNLVEQVLDLPRVSDGNGTCFGYSSHAHDARRCVHNVNVVAGLFLWRAQALGVDVPGGDEIIAGIIQREIADYRPSLGAWPYTEGLPKMNDLNHNATCIDAMLTLAPPVGQHAIQIHMQRRDYERWTDPLGQVRLLPAAGSSGAEYVDAVGTMISDRRTKPALLAQIAYWCARCSSVRSRDSL